MGLCKMDYYKAQDQNMKMDEYLEKEKKKLATPKTSLISELIIKWKSKRKYLFVMENAVVRIFELQIIHGSTLNMVCNKRDKLFSLTSWVDVCYS